MKLKREAASRRQLALHSCEWSTQAQMGSAAEGEMLTCVGSVDVELARPLELERFVGDTNEEHHRGPAGISTSPTVFVVRQKRNVPFSSLSMRRVSSIKLGIWVASSRSRC